MIKYLFLILFSLLTSKAFAYPNYIGHGYTSCLNCHYNPFGGGPLTDYGRAVGATTIAARDFYPDSMTDERLANSSGFLFKKPDWSWLRAQVNYRGFQLVRNPGTDAEVKSWINMQADGRLIFKFGENDRFLAVGNFGYAPNAAHGATTTGEEQSEWRSREYYLGFKVTPNIGVYAGLMDKIYGIRILEHIAYSRTSPQVTQNDQTHGITGHFIGESWEGGLQYFLGNMQQDEDIRMKGFSATAEKTVFGIHRLGGSFISSKNEYLSTNSMAIHGRFNLKEGSSILAEVGRTQMTAEAKNLDRASMYGLFQTYLRPARGLYVFSNIEYIKRDMEEDPYTVRWGPGVQYFPLQRLELRLDVYNTRNFAKESSTKDTWMYLFQTHVWL